MFTNVFYWMKQQLLQRKGAQRKGTKEAACLEGGMPSAHMAGKTLILVSKPLSDRDITFPVLDTERTASHKRCIWLLWLVIKRLYITLPSPLESRSSLHLSIYRNADHMSRYRTRNRNENRTKECQLSIFYEIEKSMLFFKSNLLRGLRVLAE